MNPFPSAYSDSVLKALLDQRLYIVSLGHLVYILLHSEFIRVKMNSFSGNTHFLLCYINFQFSSGALCKLIPDLFLCIASAENCRLLQGPRYRITSNYVFRYSHQVISWLSTSFLHPSDLFLHIICLCIPTYMLPRSCPEQKL